jgi:hypothetical protein
MQILTPILILLEQYRDTNDFSKWFEKLTEALYTNIRQKLTDDERKQYLVEKEKCLKVINQYAGVYRGTDKDPQSCYRVKMALLDLEMWLKDMMEEHGLYGKGSEVDWDEI